MNTEYAYIDPRETGRLRDEFTERLLAMLAALREKNGGRG